MLRKEWVFFGEKLVSEGMRRPLENRKGLKVFQTDNLPKLQVTKKSRFLSAGMDQSRVEANLELKINAEKFKLSASQNRSREE